MFHVLKIISIILGVGCPLISVYGHPQAGLQALYNLKSNQNQDQTYTRASATTCGYSSCPKFDPNKLNVHVIAHTHDDVGWLKTVDQYYYGTKKHYSPAGVQHILDSVVPQLVMDPEKRFIYVEMSFFSKWWQDQDESTRSIVRRLVDEGRLEFINGGWCMNDEATVNYHSTIEQMTLGLRFLNETFGPCGRPKVGWQIDPFGHTNEQASLFAQFGFDGMFFTRISYLDKLQRELNKSLDIVWHGDRALPGQSGSIFANIFRDGYDAPNGFCFDQLCLDDILVDNRNSYEFNMDQKGKEMIDFMRHYAKIKLTNHLLVPFGGDFQYSAAGQNFKSLDKLIRYIRENAPDIHVFYSTPSCYQLAVHQVVEEKRLRLPEKYDDFMPYDSSPTVWWSGYFSSRPSVKLVEREVADLLQVTRIISLASLLRQQAGLENRPDWATEVRRHESKCLLPLWEILGDLQHHDAVTGTEKQHVADDYVRRASDALRLCARFIGDIRRQRFNELMHRAPRYEQLRAASRQYKLDPVYLEETMFCPLLNISQCDALEADVDAQKYKQLLLANASTAAAGGSPRPQVKLTELLETRGVLVTAYNPLGRPVQQLDVRLPCNGRCDLERVQVIHVATNETMKLTRLPIPAGVATLPFRRAQTTFEILFYANVPALGSSSFVVSDENPDELVDEELSPSDSILITDDIATVKRVARNRRVREVGGASWFEYFTIADDDDMSQGPRAKRDLSQQGAADRVIVKFDMSAGVIVGLKRAIDGTFLNISQKFGFYHPARSANEPPGAYIFRANSSAPQLLDRPISFKMLKRQNGALIEIHQKWTDWIWQTVRVDAKKNYIEFDYLVGPVPIVNSTGREVVTRYATSLTNEGVFFTDSNGRQLLPRHRHENYLPENLGGSFYPVVSTMMIKNSRMHKSNKSVEAVAILVDRAQAATSLNEGNLEFLIHRRHTLDDHFGVGEPLNEPGEDGRGLVTRGRHRLFLKFQDLKEDQPLPLQQQQQPRGQQAAAGKARPRLVKLPRTPRANLTFEESAARLLRDGGALELERGQTGPSPPPSDTYIVHDQLLNDLKIESVKCSLKPMLTFDRLRVTAGEFNELLASDTTSSIAKTDLSLLNVSLPNNVHLVTLQPWSSGPMQLLLRLENLDNPLTLHPNPRRRVYSSILNLYKGLGRQQGDENNDRPTADDNYEAESQPRDDPCLERRHPRVEVDIEYLIRRIRITGFEELNLGANAKLGEVTRLDWTNESYDSKRCDSSDKPTVVKLGPRQIRTLLASFQYL